MTQVTREYLSATFERGRRPMSPPGFEIDWDDQPSRFKRYRDVARVPLPSAGELPAARFGSVLDAARRLEPPAGRLDIDALSTVLGYSNGLLSRRLAVHWNGDNETRVQLGRPTYGRGAPSGGGMYPTEIYLACGRGARIRPGLYHYDNSQHALARLSRRDATAEVRGALAGRAGEAEHFLLLSLFFWKNAFKYNNFCYHVVTQDLGAMFATMRVVALAFGSDLEVVQWYDDRKLDRLLGLETREESVFAVLPLSPSGGRQGATAPHGAEASAGSAPLRRSYDQRSRRVLSFPLVEAVHGEALSDGGGRPSADELRRCLPVERHEAPAVVLPETPESGRRRDLFEVLRRRQSSFGRHSHVPPLALEQLAALLDAGSALRVYRSDIKDESGAPSFTRLMVIALNVEGLAPGAYSYDERRGALSSVAESDLGYFLQSSYFLQNYNLRECSAVLAVVGAIEPLLEIAGARGYRALSFEVGMVAQGVYLAASALSLSCGAVLGLDNIRMNEALRLDDLAHKTFLFLLVGPSGRPDADYDFSLV